MTEREQDIPQLTIAEPNLPEVDASKLRSESIDLVPGGIPKENSFFPTGDTSRLAPTRNLQEKAVVESYKLARRFTQ